MDAELAVYSTYCGTLGNKTFKEKIVSNRYPHYFVSNNIEVLEMVEAFGWKPLLLKAEVSEDPIRSAFQAKFAKAVPDQIPQLTKYPYLFYVDDKIDFEAERLPFFMEILKEKDSSLLIRAHPFLCGNILLEFGAAMHQLRYSEQMERICGYITTKLQGGSMIESQMYWTSAILRNVKHCDTPRINNSWWTDIQHCGIECQISFNFIAQQFKSIEILPSSLT